MPPKKESSPAGEWKPVASKEVKAKAAELHKKAGEDLRAAVSARDPMRPDVIPGLSEHPLGSTGWKPATKGGRKSRRKTRRGGAIKPVRELIADLEREPTKATLENVISDLKASGDRTLSGYGEGTEIRLRMRLRPGETMEQHVRATIDGLLPLLRAVRGGRRKTTRRR